MIYPIATALPRHLMERSAGSCDDASYHSGDCSKGIALYKKYTDGVVAVLKQFPTIQIVAIVEPDSLPNLATNLGIEPHCT
jgi:cellulase/cellobiase CelA1